MISRLQLANLVKAYQARQAEQDRQNASVTNLDVRGSDADVSRAA